MGNVRGLIFVVLIAAVVGIGITRLDRVLGVTNIETYDNTWSLVVGGDVMLGRSVNTRSLKYKDFNFPFIRIKDVLSGADLAMVNLENPIVEGCKPTDHGMIFCAPPQALDGLVWSGVDSVNLSNNHTYNYGIDGYGETKKWLGQKGLGYFDGSNFWRTSVKGISIGAVGFDLVTDGRPASIEKMFLEVNKRSKEVDLLIVNLHWGAEYIDKPDEEMKRIAKGLVENGAKLIVGHHSHVIGKYEEIGGVPVIYSLGNLVFDQMWSLPTRRGMLVRFEFDGSMVTGKKFIPVEIYDYGQPRVIEDTKLLEELISGFSHSQQGSL